jgi:hypothetical protein
MTGRAGLRRGGIIWKTYPLPPSLTRFIKGRGIKGVRLAKIYALRWRD